MHGRHVGCLGWLRLPASAPTGARRSWRSRVFAPRVKAEDSEAAAERAEQLAQVERALDRLSPEKREAFLLKHVEGMSYEEMAAVTGERVPTLKMRVHRARAALLEALKEYE